MSKQTYAPVTNPSGRDYFQFVTSILMVVAGALILLRTFSAKAPVLAVLMGAGLLFLGVYRLNFVYRYLRSKKK